MELRVLEYYLVVTEYENITKAAQKLHITQPTLSRQLAQLEQELGVHLFQRSNHKIMLTEDGLLLKRRAQEIISLVDQTKVDFFEKDKMLEGIVRIGSGEFLASKILADIIASFRKEYPKVTYTFYSGNTKNIDDNIQRGLLDVGLIPEPFDTQKYDFMSMPIQEEWGILVHKDSPLTCKQSITPKDLVDIPLIVPEGSIQTHRLKKWLGKELDALNIIAKGNLLYNETVLAESNVGAVVGIRLHYNYDKIRFIPFSEGIYQTTALVWKKDVVYSLATKTFLAYVKKYFQSMESDKI